MIKLNKLTDYAIIILTHLAKGEKQFCTVNKIAQATQVPQPTVAKLMKQLSKLDLTTANRGAQGGYQINFDPAAMTLDTIVKALEGPVSVTPCNSETSTICILNQCCTLGPLWNKINGELMGVLGTYTIDDFVKHDELNFFVTQAKGDAHV